MERVYFTFGSWEKYPHQNTYMIVEAECFNAGIAEFRKKYPDVHENCLNCADYYNESQWKERVCQYYKDKEPAEILRTKVAEELLRLKVLLENTLILAGEEMLLKKEAKDRLLSEIGTTKEELATFGIDIDELTFL